MPALPLLPLQPLLSPPPWYICWISSQASSSTFNPRQSVGCSFELAYLQALLVCFCTLDNPCFLPLLWYIWWTICYIRKRKNGTSNAKPHIWGMESTLKIYLCHTYTCFIFPDYSNLSNHTTPHRKSVAYICWNYPRVFFYVNFLVFLTVIYICQFIDI